MKNRLRAGWRAHRSFALIVAAFLAFRLLMAIGFGVVGPDTYDFMRWGSLADSGLYPFVHYWAEYPPLLPWSSLALYRLSTLVPALPEDARFWYGLVLRLTFTLLDTGSLICVYAIALKLGTRLRALRTAALFAAGFVLAYAAAGWYDSMPLFFLLLALYWGLSDHYALSAVAGSIGFLIKLVPIVIVPVILRRMTTLRQSITYLGAVAVSTFVLLLPFLISGPQYLLAFVRGTLNRPTWSSVWAILDRGYTFGAVLPVQDRFSPDNVGAAPPSALPWPIIHLAFAALFLFIYTRRIEWRKPLNTVAFAGLTVNLFLIWSKGFSGQFIVYAFPFVVLVLPNRRGLAYAALLSFLWIAETPLSLLTFATAEVTTPNWFTTWLILTRTAVLIVLCFEYAARLFPRAERAFTRFAAIVLTLGWVSVAPALALMLHSYTQVRLAADPAAPAIELIAKSDGNHKTIVLPTTRVFRRLYPAASPVGETLMLPLTEHVPEDVRAQWLADLAGRGPFWFVDDQGDPESKEDNRAADAWVSDRACKVDMQWGGSALVSRFVKYSGSPRPVQASARFGDQIELTGAQLNSPTLRSGDTLCLELDWRALTQPASDYTVFVHLVDPQGRIVAQNDLQPQGSFAPTSHWKEGKTVADKHGLIPPANLPAGAYTLRVGLYRSDDQTPLRVTQGDNLMSDNLGVNLTQVTVTP